MFTVLEVFVLTVAVSFGLFNSVAILFSFVLAWLLCLLCLIMSCCFGFAGLVRHLFVIWFVCLLFFCWCSCYMVVVLFVFCWLFGVAVLFVCCDLVFAVVLFTAYLPLCFGLLLSVCCCCLYTLFWFVCF